MSGTTVTKYLCDLCDAKAEEVGSRVPAGWVKIIIENRYVDRDFTDKHVCPSCVGVIVKGAAK